MEITILITVLCLATTMWCMIAEAIKRKTTHQELDRTVPMTVRERSAQWNDGMPISKTALIVMFTAGILFGICITILWKSRS